MNINNPLFLKYFPKDNVNNIIVFDLYTFDNLFRLLLKNNYSHSQALNFVLSNCSLSALVFQERFYNNKYLKLNSKDAIEPELSAIKSNLINDLLNVLR